MKSAGKARNNGLYRHIRTSKEIIRNLLNDSLSIIIEYVSNDFWCIFVNFMPYTGDYLQSCLRK